MRDLQRFLDAQAVNFDEAVAELEAGHKRTHWIWYIFPQIAGLGNSDYAKLYAIDDLDEAKRYLAHPVLGPRYRRCVELAVRNQVTFPFPDNLKFRSSLTLFAAVSPWVAEQLTAAGLTPDPETLKRL
jgi:uncharacterized protein (DUF1810 family)